VTDFTSQDLTGARFEDVYLTNARWSFPVRRCLRAVLNEEWEHRLYAERDFDVLESRLS
jgi:hypothetical protein